MKKFKIVLAVLTVLLALAGCQKKPVEENVEVRFGVLKGPTGIGASYLLDKNDKQESLNKYAVTVAAEATDIVAQVISGQLDIAAVPTNVAATLYNKTEGGVQLLALNTAGVLYILEKGDTVHSVKDLEGKTIYSVGQGSNPEYVLNYILASNGLKVGENVTVEFQDSAELTTKMAAGNIDICMLPVPAVTTVLMKNSEVRIALNMTEEWNKLNNGSVLTMGCVVVRKEFAEKYPQTVANFLKEYEESINYVKTNVQDAAALCEKFEIVPKAAVAAKAIPDANLIFVAGKDMKGYISGYYKILAEADIKSIGGKLPGDDFYYEK